MPRGYAVKNWLVNMNEELWAGYCDAACYAARDGNMERAEEQWRLAWNLAQGLPDSDSRYRMSLEYLADLLCMRENYVEAEPLLTNLLALKMKHVPDDSLNIAATHNTLAGLYFTLKRLDLAEGHCKRALEMTEREMGSENSDVAMVLHNLAMVHHAQKRYKEAELAYLRALDITSNVYGGDHHDTVSIAEHYSGLLDAMGRKEEAQDCSKTRVLPLLDRLVRTVGEEKTDSAAATPTNKGFVSATLQGIKRDPRRSNQCMYRIKPLPPINE